jgi:hypothetical protein
LALLALALSGAGCVPNVAWLPDSSGFAYLGGATGRQLVLYDAAAGRPRVLVADTGANTEWPAVSPDGRRVAVARLFDYQGNLARSSSGSTFSTLQVVVYGLDGREVHTSRPVPWQPRASCYTPHVQPMLFWSPAGDKLVIYGDLVTGVYDLASGGLVRLDDTIPWVFEATPVLPDGRGFLAWRIGLGGQEEALGPRVVTWYGQVTRLTWPPPPHDPQRPGPSESAWAMIPFSPFQLSSRWEGDWASASWSGARLEVDPGKGLVSGGAFEPERAEDGKVVQHCFPFPGGGALVRLVEVDQGGPRTPDERGFFVSAYWVRVEVV